MEIDVIAAVVSPASMAYIEAFRGDAILGEIVIGDLLRLAAADGRTFELVARRATWMFTTRFDAPTMPDPMPAELVPFLQRGATGFRERIIRAGDQFRVRSDDGGGFRLDEMLAFE